MIGLTLLFASCETVEPVPTAPPPVVLTFPDFPPDAAEAALFVGPGGVIVFGGGPEIRLKEPHVVLPLSQWLSITDYVISVREVEAKYNAIYGERSE